MSGSVKPSEPSDDQLSFRFVSGHRALDLTATFGGRYGAGIERLRTPTDLGRWLASAGIAISTVASAQDLEDAREVREVIYRLARAALQDQAVENSDLDALNAWARKPRAAPQLDRRLRQEWASSEPVTGALALIACEAIDLLSGAQRQLIRECAAAPACSLLYLDHSRGRRRRWCQMERCGSRAKMAEYRKRRTSENPGAKPTRSQQHDHQEAGLDDREPRRTGSDAALAITAASRIAEVPR